MNIEHSVAGSTTTIAPRAEPSRPTDRIAVPAARPGIEPSPRPHRNLLTYYGLCSLLLGPFFWAYLIPHFFRYRTLRYHFDDEGVTMRWGVLFRREISLTYARIQDIHLTSNVVERWLGLAKIQVQTASGNASAEMVIEGLQHFEQVRDFLYERMRGTREQAHRSPSTLPPAQGAAGAAVALDAATLDELAVTLRAVVDEVRALRGTLEREQAANREVPHA
jgi:membrane protein YdbS with pleckstrin-like domain